MVNLTIPFSEEVAAKVSPILQWVSPILELSLVGFKTSADASAAEIIEFFSQNPTDEAVLNYFVSDQVQARVRDLLAKNREGVLSEQEGLELDEHEKIERIVRRCKIEVLKRQQPQKS
jgi:hypothetical protein